MEKDAFEPIENHALADAMLEEGICYARDFVNKNYLLGLRAQPVERLNAEERNDAFLRLFQIDRLVYNVDEINSDKLTSVYSALYNIGASALLILRGSPEGLSFYLGVRSAGNAPTAGAVLESSFKGNFPGSILRVVPQEEIGRVLDWGKDSETGEFGKWNAACVSVVPSTRDEDRTRFVQGMEKLIDAMKGKDYAAVFIGEPVDSAVMERRKSGLTELFTNLSPFASTQLSYGENYSKTVTEGLSENFSRTINRSVTDTNSRFQSHSSSWGSGNSVTFWDFTFSSSSSHGYSSGSSWASAVTNGSSDTNGTGKRVDTGETRGDNRTITVTRTNRQVSEILERIDRHLTRIQNCESFGLWDVAGYFLSKDIQSVVTAASAYKALMAGYESGAETSCVNIWNASDEESSNREALLDTLRYCVHPRFSISVEASALPLESQTVTPCSLISGNEMPLFMSLPRYSVPGVTVLQTAAFGRNVRFSLGAPDGVQIPLGNVYHMGHPEPARVSLDLESFRSHCFITGTTGSGKSNATYRILDEMIRREIPFLVIEPAKGEYKRYYGGLPGVHVFSTNPKYYAMLRINPFRFHRNIHVLEHLDRLIEIFNACWPLYAAMPAILKESFEQAYVKRGWDLENSIYIPNGRGQFPTFKDVLEILPEIIGSSAYSAESKGNYTGALVTRVKSLSNGISGQVFCAAEDIDDEVLFDSNTITDLSRVSSLETKSLLMGVLVLKLNERRMCAGKENQPLRHITVMEEAHNILKRTPSGGPEGANVQAKSVEMISSAIAEMRTYGEGFLIVDQSPSAVDASAIRNTNTKIIMRLPDYADCQAAGLSMGLNESQIREIARLPMGVAVIYQNNWVEAVLTKIDKSRETYHQDDLITEQYDLARVRGQLVCELVAQYEAKNLRLERLHDIVRASALNRHKKEELYRTLAELYAVCEQNALNNRLIAAQISSLSACGGLFRALPLRFSGDYQSVAKITADCVSPDDYRAIKAWFLRLAEHLDNYAMIPDEAMKRKVLRYLLLSQRFQEDKKQNKYHLIYEAAYGKRGKPS